MILWLLFLAWADGGRDMTLYRDVSYGDGGAVDIYVPDKTDKTTPVLLFVHGGAWISGDKGEYGALGRHFAGQGVLTLVVNYRLSPAVRHPAHAQDLARAVTWAAGQAGRYGFDPAHLFLCGHSAGAHMLAFLGTGGQGPAVKGYIGIAGIYDLPELLKRWPGYRDWFLEKAFGPPGKSWEAASPARRPPRAGSRWLVLHGESDELVDVEQSDRFADHLKKAGAAVTRKSYPALDHYGVLRDLGASRNPLTADILAFLGKK